MSKVKQAKQEEQEVVKQIVLTQEQFDALINIYHVLDNTSDSIADLIDSDLDPMKLGYNLGMINSELQTAYNTIDELTDAINPNRNSWFDDEDEDENN
jgi:hypothetical protein